MRRWIASTTSDEQYQQLQRLLAEAAPLRARLLWIYQTQSRGNHWHPDGDLDLLKRALDQHRFVGLGGLVSVIRCNLQQAQDLLGSIGDILDAADAQAHVFGVGNYALLTFCLSQRWFRSADSARWLQGFHSRSLLTTDGTMVSGKNLRFSGLDCAEQHVRSMQAWLEADHAQRSLFPQRDPLEEEEALQCPWVT